jgi:hypothetical protein
MRGIIHDQVAHKFIEGPMQSAPVNYYNQQVTGEKAANNPELTQENVFQGNADDMDIPTYDVNERYD